MASRRMYGEEDSVGLLWKGGGDAKHKDDNMVLLCATKASIQARISCFQKDNYRTLWLSFGFWALLVRTVGVVLFFKCFSLAHRIWWSSVRSMPKEDREEVRLTSKTR